MRAQDDEHYIKLVTDFIKKFSMGKNSMFFSRNDTKAYHFCFKTKEMTQEHSILEII